MSRAALVTSSGETLVFRDGKPFGAEANLAGGRISWPMPSTIAGMVRSRIGLSREVREPGYFDRSKPSTRERNIQRLMQVALAGILPVNRGLGTDSPWLPLFPAPADAAIFPVELSDRLSVLRFTAESLAASEGCDDLWPNWLLPIHADARKPAARRPSFWHLDRFNDWLLEKDFAPLTCSELGVAGATAETRIHTAIDPGTLTVREGALFEAPGIRLAVRGGGASDGGESIARELGLAIFLRGLEAGDDPYGPVHFGGERRIAFNEDGENVPSAFPAPSADLRERWAGQRFLRLVLTSPGSFGGWAPEWLLPTSADRRRDTPWVTAPGTLGELRLRSAFVPGWIPLSGWDYDTASPKPMRKIVPAGSVYLVEMRRPAESAALAEALWGKSLCVDPQAERDGFGTAVVGLASRVCASVL